MAETLVENKICRSCGADVRSNALFCYNCGGAVASQAELEKEDQTNKIGNVRLRETLVENGKNNESKDKKTESDNHSAVEKNIVKPILKPEIQRESKLKNTSAPRRKSATFQKKIVEIKWEEPENSPNGWFIFAAIVLTLFALGIFFLAAYLK